MLPVRRVALVLVLLLTSTGACRSGGTRSDEAVSSTSTTPARAPDQSTPPEPSPLSAALPDVVVRNVATGSDVNLRALGLPDRPTLFWFWAPH